MSETRAHPTAIEISRALLANAQAQAQAARADDWQTVTCLADERDGLLAALSHALATRPADAGEHVSLAAMLTKVLVFDREVAGRAEAEARRLSAELAQTRQGQTVAAAYARPAHAAQTDLFDVAG